MNDPYTALIATNDKQVSLLVNTRPSKEGAHTTVVVPTGDERQLYYFDWVQKNIDTVTAATGGRVGYVHIPDMGVPGLNEFSKYFYPQVRKEALIVDVRGNGGGNVSPQVIERLRREVALIDIARNTTPSPDPATAMLGPKVMLIDEFSASDGDIVGYRFRKYGLGQLIGKRTWGGVVGIRGTLPLLDGGYLMRPEFASYDTEGKTWPMEGRGVEPDIVVENDPAKEFAGQDQQLDKAIQVIMQDLAKKPVVLPGPPPYPNKSR
jgi:tricorn protease